MACVARVLLEGEPRTDIKEERSLKARMTIVIKSVTIMIRTGTLNDV